MALRLNVLAGELENTDRFRVRGWLRVRGEEREMHLELTGNCSPDLAGWKIRFKAPGYEEDDEPAQAEVAPGVESIPDENEPGVVDDSGDAQDDYPFSEPDGPWVNPQVGPTGTMTVRQVKIPDGPADEFTARTKKGETPPFTLKQCLYLEWFSQQGRVVVELIDPSIEFVQFTELAPATVPPAAQESTSTADAEQEDEDDVDDVDADEDASGEATDDDETDAPDDGFSLLPEGLQEELDAQTAATERALRDSIGVEDKPRSLMEQELMDECIENEPGEIISALLERTLRLPKPAQATEEQAEQALKAVLAQLALFNISLSICKHFSARDAYRLLIEEICPKERAYKKLRNTAWIQGFMTSEFCRACEAEFEQDYAERERKREESGETEAPPWEEGDEDVPF